MNTFTFYHELQENLHKEEPNHQLLSNLAVHISLSPVWMFSSLPAGWVGQWSTGFLPCPLQSTCKCLPTFTFFALLFWFSIYLRAIITLTNNIWALFKYSESTWILSTQGLCYRHKSGTCEYIYMCIYSSTWFLKEFQIAYKET